MPETKKYNLKEEIINLLETIDTPSSVKDIQDKLVNIYNKTSIYRQLDSLFQAGKVRKLDIGKEALFEIKSHRHAHLQCIECGMVSCVSLPDSFLVNVGKIKGAKIVDFDISFKGICTNCD